MESCGDEEEAGVAVSWETPVVEWLVEGIGNPVLVGLFLRLIRSQVLRTWTAGRWEGERRG